MAVILETSLGDLTIDLLTQERPRCCLNFLKLCKMKYYNFALFHSVQRNLVAQAGDPTYTGKGGESLFYHLYGDQAKYFEMETKPRIKHRDKGIVSMVNNGNNQHGSQFFITLAKNLDYLDGVHTVFGEVSEGFEILEKINEAYTDEAHRPFVDIRIYHTIILDDPFDDPKGLEIPEKSPEPTAAQLDSVRISPDEVLDDTKGKTEDEVDELNKEKEAKANAMLLEMIGDLPDQDVRPPDSVLFVCKLNPVTTEEDLEIIFSRFGTIKSCEVIKDQKSGESLQYAFVEFDTPDACEKAYFKMDNVLIDDRRIHVDFSQSVSKFKWKGKGKGVEHLKPISTQKFDAVSSTKKSPKRYKSPRNVHDEERGSKSHKKSKKRHSRSRSRDRSKNSSKSSRRRSSSPALDDRRSRRSRSRDRYRDERKQPRGEFRSRSRSRDRRRRSASASPPPRKSASKIRRSTSSSPPPRKSASKIRRSTSASPPPRKSANKIRRSTSASPPPRKSASKIRRSTSASPPPRKSASKIRRSSSSRSPPKRKHRRASYSDDSDDGGRKRRGNNAR